MKNKTKYFLLLFIFCVFCAFSQNRQLNLSNANTQLYKGNIYAFGLNSIDKKSKLIVYKLGLDLSIKDSLVIDLLKGGADNFLLLTSDTLHDYLNIYLQKKENLPAGKAGKLVQIYRFNKNFKLIATIDDIDVVRLNSISTFESEIFYFKNDVYTIKSVTDTSGKQFYLNKYGLKSDPKTAGMQNFEYEPKWQFPFERKNINSAHIIYADKIQVILYVNVIDGNRKGQWLLKINSISGTLKKGFKLNAKGDLSFYSYGKIFIDTTSKNIYVQGQKFSDKDLNQVENKMNLSGKTFITAYLAQFDSLGEQISKDEFKIPILEQKGTINKIPVNYILQTKTFFKNKEDGFTFECDIFKGLNNSFCYTYCNSNIFNLSLVEDKFTLDKNLVNTNPLIEKYYLTNDILDMNGKLCMDSLKNFEKLFYTDITFNVKCAYKLDDTGSPVWLLKKNEPKKNNDNYSILGPVKKIYQVTLISNILKSENPYCLVLSGKQYIISKQSLTDKFQLQLFNW